MYSIRLDSLAADREWQDIRINGHLEANRPYSGYFGDDYIHQKATVEKKASRPLI